jgi:RNA polymerase sigma factor (sigma-70 family)
MPAHIVMDLESSIELLQQVKRGDADALDRLLRRYLVPLRRWATGRLPQWARDMADTQDMVQDAVWHTLHHLAAFQPSRDGGLHAYLRTAVINRIRDELRRAHRRPQIMELDENVPSPFPSPFVTAMNAEARDRYEAALSSLTEGERDLIIARVEWGLDYKEIAAALDRPTPDAARVAVRRALLKLAKMMKPVR